MPFSRKAWRGSRQQGQDRQPAPLCPTHGDGDKQVVSLADHIGRMKEGQEKILLRYRRYLSMLQEQPASGNFQEEGASRCCSPTASRVVGHLTEIPEGKQLQSVAKGVSISASWKTRKTQEAEKAADE